MGHIRLMGTVLLYASCEIIFLTFNYKIRFSFIDSMNINLFSSNKKGGKNGKKKFAAKSHIMLQLASIFLKLGGVLKTLLYHQ